MHNLLRDIYIYVDDIHNLHHFQYRRYYQFKHHLDLYTYYYYKCSNNSICIYVYRLAYIYLLIALQQPSAASYILDPSRATGCFPEPYVYIWQLNVRAKSICYRYMRDGLHQEQQPTTTTIWLHFQQTSKRFSSLLTAEATAYI